jgi:hypothetical protein
MIDLQLLDCFQPELVELERVHYFPRQLLTAEDMVADQDYFRQKLRRHNRYLHGWGVVCGLEVSPAPTGDLPWRVKVGFGYALGQAGDEIFVGQEVFLDLAKCGPGTATDPCEPDLLWSANGHGTGATLFVAPSRCGSCPPGAPATRPPASTRGSATASRLDASANCRRPTSPTRIGPSCAT